MELKNQLTKQNVSDAVEQYKNDRTPDEVLFSFKRCIVHFAVDDNEVRMCTELKGKKSWFLPFTKVSMMVLAIPQIPMESKRIIFGKKF